MKYTKLYPYFTNSNNFFYDLSWHFFVKSLFPYLLAIILLLCAVFIGLNDKESNNVSIQVSVAIIVNTGLIFAVYLLKARALSLWLWENVSASRTIPKASLVSLEQIILYVFLGYSLTFIVEAFFRIMPY